MSRVPQAPIVSNSFGAGHAGVAYDLELMQQGWLEAKGEDSAIYDQVRGLVDEFLALYEAHILHPLEELEKHKNLVAGKAEEREGRGAEHPLFPSHPRNGEDVQNEGDGSGGFSGSSDPLEIVTHMGSEDYARWSPAARSRALAWLCDEALSAATMNDLVKKVLEAREVVDRKDREVRDHVRQSGDAPRGEGAKTMYAWVKVGRHTDEG